MKKNWRTMFKDDDSVIRASPALQRKKNSKITVLKAVSKHKLNALIQQKKSEALSQL